jgi:hypothetical protein
MGENWILVKQRLELTTSLLARPNTYAQDFLRRYGAEHDLDTTIFDVGRDLDSLECDI